ncbi:MAG: virulence RhuM family protein, partial [Flavobacteriaceae bacterium]|nr:virulence RhuM family protein [Flavobacteriaceae bacterium]
MNKQDQIIIYSTNDGLSSVEVQIQDESVWLNRKQLSVLFDRDVKTLGKHLGNVFNEGELKKDTTVAKFATVQNEGNRKVTRLVEHYNLDVIISVGYRVKSKRGTQFRIWANTILKDYLIKGYAVNKKRLQQTKQQLQELKKIVQLQENVISEYQLETDEAQG